MKVVISSIVKDDKLYIYFCYPNSFNISSDILTNFV